MKVLQILDEIPGLVFSWHSESGITEINTPVKAILGYTQTEIQDNIKLIEDIIHPVDMPLVQQHLASLQKQAPGSSIIFKVRCRHKNGKIIYLQVTLSKNDKVPGLYIGLGQDITDQQIWQNTLQLQNELFAHVKMPIFATNLQGQIVYWNEATRQLFNWDAVTWGKTLIDTLNIDKQDIETLLKKIIKKKSTTQEYSLHINYKEPFWVKLSGQILADQSGLPIGFVFSLIDTTQHKTSETLREISTALVSSLDLEETLSIILESLEKLLKFDSTAIYLLTPNNRLRMMSGRGLPYIEVTMASATEIERFPLDEEVITGQYSVAIADVRQDDRWTSLAGTEYIRSWLGVPLLVRNKPVGLVTIDRATIDPFTPDHVEIVETFSRHAAIALQNAELYSRIRNLSNRIVAAQEEERRRISRELHDEMGQALTAIKLNLQMLRTAPPPKKNLMERLDEMVELTDTSLQEVRRLAMDLRPAMLDDLGLVPTIRWYNTQFQKRTTTNINFSTSHDLPRLLPEIETVLYRVIQEALTNVSRHANAQNVTIALAIQEPKTIKLIICDDGQGFDYTANSHHDFGGVGLVGMKERVEDHHGQLKISSAPGSGTQLQILIPNSFKLSHEQ